MVKLISTVISMAALGALLSGCSPSSGANGVSAEDNQTPLGTSSQKVPQIQDAKESANLLPALPPVNSAYCKDFPNITPSKAQAALLVAISNGDADCVQLTLEQGADPNRASLSVPTDERSEMVRPLHWAAKVYRTSTELVVKVLIDAGANVNSTNLKNQSPLELALTKRGDGKFNSEWAALGLIRYGKPNLEFRMDLDTVLETKGTPLHLMIDRRDSKLVEELLRAGARVDATILKWNSEITPLDMMGNCGSLSRDAHYSDKEVSIVQALLKYGARPTSCNLSAAILSKNKTVIEAYISSKNLQKEWLSMAVAPAMYDTIWSVLNSYNSRPFTDTKLDKEYRKDLVKKIFDLGADINEIKDVSMFLAGIFFLRDDALSIELIKKVKDPKRFSSPSEASYSNALLYAISNLQWDVYQAMVRQGSAPSTSSQWTNNLLIKALASFRQDPLWRPELIRYIESKNFSSDLLFVMNDDTDLIEKMVMNGADINIKMKDSETDWRELSLLDTYLKGSWNINVKHVAKLIDLGLRNKVVPGIRTQGVKIRRLVEENNLDVLKLLTEKKFILDAVESDGRYNEFVIFKVRTLAMFDFLLQQGFSAHEIDARTGRNIFHKIAQAYDRLVPLEGKRAIIARAKELNVDINKLDSFGYTPFYHAVDNATGRTNMDVSIKILQAFVQAGADVNLRGKNSETSLIKAVRGQRASLDNLKLTAALLKFGCDKAVVVNGKSAYDEAKDMEREALLELDREKDALEKANNDIARLEASGQKVPDFMKERQTSLVNAIAITKQLIEFERQRLELLKVM